MELVGLHRQLTAVHSDHQFAQVLSILAGLHHGGAAVDDSRFLQRSMAVAANDDVDAGHGLSHTHVIAAGEFPVLSSRYAAVAKANNHIHLLFLVENVHHVLGGLDGVGERSCAALGIDSGLFAEHPEDAEAQTAALDHLMAADHPILRQTLEIRQRCVFRIEVGVRSDYRRNMSSFGGDSDRLTQSVGTEVEFMVAEGGGIVTHPGQELQFGAGLANGPAVCGPHAVVAIVQDQHRAKTLAGFLPLAN